MFNHGFLWSSCHWNNEVPFSCTQKVLQQPIDGEVHPLCGGLCNYLLVNCSRHHGHSPVHCVFSDYLSCFTWPKNRFITSIALLLDFRERAALHDSISNRIILLRSFCRVTHLCFRVLVKTPRSQCHPLHFCTCRNVPCWRLYNAISAHWPFLGGVTLWTSSPPAHPHRSPWPSM